MSAFRADRTEIERGIALLFDPGDAVEVRIPKTRVGVVAGLLYVFLWIGAMGLGDWND
jgi:hypothetical protein